MIGSPPTDTSGLENARRVLCPGRKATLDKNDGVHRIVESRPEDGCCLISDRVQNLAQIRPGRPPALGRARQERLNPRPLLVGQIRRVALGLLLNFGHPATRRWGPHDKLESRPNLPFNGFSNGL